MTEGKALIGNHRPADDTLRTQTPIYNEQHINNIAKVTHIHFRHPIPERGYGYENQGERYRENRPLDRHGRDPVIERDSLGVRGPHLDREVPGVQRNVPHPPNDRLAPPSDRLGQTPYSDGHGYPPESYDGYQQDGQFDRYGNPLPPETAPLAPGPQGRDYYNDRRGNQYTANRNYTAEDDFHSLRQRYDEEY